MITKHPNHEEKRKQAMDDFMRMMFHAELKQKGYPRMILDMIKEMINFSKKFNQN